MTDTTTTTTLDASELDNPYSEQVPEQTPQTAPEQAPTSAPEQDAPTSAPEQDAPQAQPQTQDEPDAKDRRGRGDLEADVKGVTDAFVMGTIETQGKPLTPHRIAKLAQERDQGKPLSVGAVSAVLRRWTEIGFADVGGTPFAFRDYTDAGREQGLASLKAANRQANKAAKTQAEPVNA